MAKQQAAGISALVVNLPSDSIYGSLHNTEEDSDYPPSDPCLSKQAISLPSKEGLLRTNKSNKKEGFSKNSSTNGTGPLGCFKG